MSGASGVLCASERPVGSRRWRVLASCRDKDPDLFFPERGDRERIASAISICRSCPVIEDCARYWDEHQITMGYSTPGIWAGVHHPTRRTPLRQRDRSIS